MATIIHTTKEGSTVEDINGLPDIVAYELKKIEKRQIKGTGILDFSIILEKDKQDFYRLGPLAYRQLRTRYRNSKINILKINNLIAKIDNTLETMSKDNQRE